MTVSGLVGELRYSYQLAASLGGWTLETVGPSLSRKYCLRVVLKQRMTPWFERRPLDLYLSINNGQWVWNAIAPWTLDSDGKTIRLDLEGVPTIIKQGAAHG